MSKLKIINDPLDETHGGSYPKPRNEMRRFECTAYSRYLLVSTEYPYLKSTTDDFDLELMEKENMVELSFEGRFFEGFVEEARFDDNDAIWCLTFVIHRELTSH